jgi:hypothetical protein
MSLLNRIAGLFSKPAASQAPAPKEHPLVTKAKERAKLNKVAYGIVWRNDGSPAIERDWIINLPSSVRPEIERQLKARGYALDEDSNVIKV